MAFRSWFPLSLSEQAAFYKNFTRVFAENAAALGFTAEDVANLEADNAVMQFLAQTQISLKHFRLSFQGFRDNMTRGIVENANEFMPFPASDIPPGVEPNMFDRLFFLSDRITSAKGYNAALGELFGILPKSSPSLKPNELEPRIKAKAVGEANLEVRFVRGKTAGVNLYFIRSRETEIHDLGKFFYSPAIVEIPLLDKNKPELIQIFARYLIGNDIAGKSSPSIELVVAP